MVSLELAGHLHMSPEQAAQAYDAAFLSAAQPFLVPG
jgi:hypothetical protein